MDYDPQSVADLEKRNQRVLSSGLIPFKKPRNTCLLLSVDCKKHVSYYRQTVLDHIAMGMLTVSWDGPLNLDQEQDKYLLYLEVVRYEMKQ